MNQKTLFLFLTIFNIFHTSLIAQQTCPPSQVAGKLAYDNSSSTPLNASIVFLKTNDGSVISFCGTDLNGNFSMCNIPSGNYQLMVLTNIPWGGVNSIDALFALKYFTQQISLDSLELIAGNVNIDSAINALDALLISQRFVQLTTNFDAGDWVFENPMITVSDSSYQFLNIKGRCIGDLNGSYKPNYFPCGDTLIDPRDNQKYPTIQIGSQCWMKKNLNIGNMVVSTIDNQTIHSNCSDNGIIEKYCSNNDTNNCKVYGGLYDWDEMMQYDSVPGIQGICPTGWHIPTDAEFCTLMTFIDPSVDCSLPLSYITGTNAGGKLKETGTLHWKSPNSGATNSSGFTALGSGNRDVHGNLSFSLKWASILWTSNSTGMNGIIWSMRYSHSKISHGKESQQSGLALRCIKD